MAELRGLLRVSEQELVALAQQGLTLDDLVAAASNSDKNYPVWKRSGRSVLIPRYSSGVDKLKVTVTRKPKMPTYTFNQTLREYQQSPVADSIKVLRKTLGMTLQAACGTGKTVMGLSIAAELGDKVVVLVDQIDIAKQWKERIEEFTNATCEVMGGGSPVRKNLKANFTIIVAQSLWRQDWMDEPIQCDLLIVDEAHVFSAPRFFDSLANIDYYYSIALTATPDRKDELEWVFQNTLGNTTVEVAGQPMISRVLQVHSPLFSPGVDPGDYNMAWCQAKRGMTTMAGCRECPMFAGFPNCGGNLPVVPMTGQIRWGEKSNHTQLVKAACGSIDYLNWIHKQIGTLIKQGRNILVFSQFKDGILDVLYKNGVDHYGKDVCGWFTGNPETAQKKNRAQELHKQVTYVTYGVADKALDVPEKDCAVFVTPKSDVRQAKGRIERIREGKKQPLIIDPVHTNIPVLIGMSRKRLRIYRETNSPVTHKNV